MKREDIGKFVTAVQWGGRAHFNADLNNPIETHEAAVRKAEMLVTTPYITKIKRPKAKVVVLQIVEVK